MKKKQGLMSSDKTQVPEQNIMKTRLCNMQKILKVVKNEKFEQINFDTFLIFVQNINCGYMLELPC